MREIDSSQDRSDARLSRALRSLSAASPTDAPPEIGGALASAFRRHHARRWAVRRAAIAAAIIAVVLPAAVLLLKKPPAGPPAAKVPDSAAVSPSAVTLATPVANASTSQSQTRKYRSTSRRKETAAAPRNDFVALPSSDQAVRGEELRLIRLELTGRALRLVGAPVSEEIADRRVLADFVVGQDGTPYAVRLVR